MIIFRQFLTKQNKSILSAQYLVLGVQIACGVWWAGGVFWQKKACSFFTRTSQQRWEKQ